MRRYWTRWLPAVAALLLVVGGLLFRSEISLRYQMRPIAYAEEKTISAFECARRHNADTLAALVSESAPVCPVLPGIPGL